MPRLGLLTLLSLCLVFQTSAWAWMQTNMPLSEITVEVEIENIQEKENTNIAHAFCPDEAATHTPYFPDCSDNASCDCIHAHTLLPAPATPLLTGLIGKSELPIRLLVPYHIRAIPHYRPPISN